MRPSKTVLTTGSNSGIGLATVIRSAQLGFRSVGTVRSEAKAAVVHDEAARAGVEVETVLLDVTDPDGCARVACRPTAPPRFSSSRRTRAGPAAA